MSRSKSDGRSLEAPNKTRFCSHAALPACAGSRKNQRRRGPNRQWVLIDAFEIPDMKVIDIPLPPNVDRLPVRKIIEDICIAGGLRVTLRTTLKKYRHSIHWHFKNGDESGTLEITFWPAECRAWLSIQAGRDAPWLEARIALLQGSFQRAFWGRQARIRCGARPGEGSGTCQSLTP